MRSNPNLLSQQMSSQQMQAYNPIKHQLGTLKSGYHERPRLNHPNEAAGGEPRSSHQTH